MRKHSILVVDDDDSTRKYLSSFLSSRGYLVDGLATGDEVVGRLRSGTPPSAVILDLLMPGTTGLEVLAQMQGVEPKVPVIVLSGVDQVGTVVQAMKLGASDYLIKPFDEGELELALKSVLGNSLPLPQRPAVSAPGVTGEIDLTSANPKLQQIRNIALRVADTDVPVLILGESGVGKEVVARFLHTHSDRHHQPFVKVNCAALPSDLMESELFGYERGAFTGAMRDKPGKFELAGNGTIFLDEIAEMSPNLQAKLLHILQDGEYNRLGGTRPKHVTARILAATNKRLEDAVVKGDFREDLLYRLNVIKIEIPPLRDRREDIPMLCNFFLEKYREKYHRGGLLLPDTMVDAFLRYNWPGNVRQLENVIKRYVILPDFELVLSDLRDPEAPFVPDTPSRLSLKEVSASAAEEAEKELIMRTLEEVHWNRKRAAQQLNICYKSLLNKLRRWQVPGRPRAHGHSASEV